jgi:hypothetical protein
MQTDSLGIVVSREWLISSGISSIYEAPITFQTTFEGFDNRLRNHLREGYHGPPLRWLSWQYLLRGRWLGNGNSIENMLLDQTTWQSGKAAMKAMLDVQIYVVFDFLKRRTRNESTGDLPPQYGTHLDDLLNIPGDNTPRKEGGDDQGMITTAGLEFQLGQVERG